MSVRFYGHFADSSTPAAPPAPPHDALRHLPCDGGAVAFAVQARQLSHSHDPQGGCVALGAPRFDDAELAALAHARGDAAAWREAFRRHGERAPNGVRGRFAAVVWQTEPRQVWLVTDRFATWPLCYSTQHGTLGFSDRADRVPGASRQLSEQALFEYLYFHMIPAPTTVFSDVSRLPAGHVLSWTRGKAALTRWWQPVFDDAPHPDLEDSKQRFRQIIEAAVAREATGHQVGAFLSGGTDSSTVAGMLTKVLGHGARTYSIGFDAAGYDEMAYARIAAQRFGTDHHEYYVTPEDLLAGIPTVAAHYDQPFGNSSAVPAWICASRARADGIDKLLAGDGGDELFGGNSRYAKQRVFGWYDTIPSPLRRAVLQPAATLPGLDRVPLVKKGVSYIEQARVPMPDRIQMYNMLLRLGIERIFTPDFLSHIDLAHPAARQRDTWQAARSGNLVNRMLAFDWTYTLADNDLPKVIGTADLAGVDVGFPLLSDELLDFSLTIPPDWKLKGLTLRWFFKEALRGFLPDEIIAKKKHGFGLPFGVWACRHPGLRQLAGDVLAGVKTRGIVRADFVDALLDTHLPAHPGYYGEMVWILMMAELWMRAHIDNDRSPGAVA